MSKIKQEINVLIDVDSFDPKIGSSNDVLDLARYTQSMGLNIYIAGEINPEFYPLIERVGITIIPNKSCPISRKAIVLYLFSTVTWIRNILRYNIDLVHINYVSWGPSVGMAARILGIPIVARAGGGNIPGNLSRKWVNRYFANCEAQASNQLESELKSKVRIVGDLLNVDRIINCKGLEAPLPELTEGVPVFVFIGQLVERKGIDVLVQAFSKMTKPAQLLVVGGDWQSEGYPQTVRKMVRSLSLEEHVHLIDYRTDALAILKTADVFVLPSLWEARPRAIMEAMYLEKCVLATNVGGIPSLIEDGKSGRLVSANNVVELADALDALADSSETRKLLSRAAKKYADDNLTPMVTARNYYDNYKELVCRARNKSEII